MKFLYSYEYVYISPFSLCYKNQKAILVFVCVMVLVVKYYQYLKKLAAT